MSATLACAALSFFAATALTPVVRWICVRWRKFDFPGPLKIHLQPVPRLGGVAIIFALAISLAITLPGKIPGPSLWLFLAALGLVWLAGFIDDLRGLSPAVRVIA